MNRESVTKLRLDRRLLHRRGWLSPQELQRELEALPDVSHKAITLGAAERSDSGGSGETGEPEAHGTP